MVGVTHTPDKQPRSRYERGDMVYTFTSRQQAEDFFEFAGGVFLGAAGKLTLEQQPPLVRFSGAYQDEIEMFVARALAFLRGYECAKARIERHLSTQV